MAMIQIDPDFVDSKASEIEGLGNQIDDLIKQVVSKIGELDPVWQGQSEAKFLERWNSLKPSLDQIRPVLVEQIPPALKAIASRFREADNAAI